MSCRLENLQLLQTCLEVRVSCASVVEMGWGKADLAAARCLPSLGTHTDQQMCVTYKYDEFDSVQMECKYPSSTLQVSPVLTAINYTPGKF